MDHSKSVRLFEKDWMEKLSHVHPITPLVLWVPVISFLFYRSATVHGLSAGEWLSLGFAGLLIWTATEYVLHRFVFHWNPQSAWGKRFVFIMHGIHHDYPDDATRLVMPPAPAILMASLFFPLFYYGFGPIHAEAVFGFFLIGYLCYDYIHYSVHFFRPRTPIGKFLKQYHMQHHFVSPQAKWGVSSPLWDYIVGTVRQKTPSSKVART